MAIKIVEEAPSLSRNNRRSLQRYQHCGCYFCMETFDVSEVTKFADHGNTGLCPRCDTDTLVPGITDTGLLQSMCERWMCASAPAA